MLPAIKTLLCLGAHCDDIEIGAGGTIMRLLAENPGLAIHWVVLGGMVPQRVAEARAGADLFLSSCEHRNIVIKEFRDSFFPYQGESIKEFFEELKRDIPNPDLILTHYRDDAHQDHRLTRDFTANTWRDHAIWEYEIPKYDGDLGRPNLYVTLPNEIADRKSAHLMQAYPSQARRHWFTPDTFLGLMRVRGVESGPRTHYAEAFHCRKVVL